MFEEFSHFVNRAGVLYVVGGAVRDVMMGIKPKDIDFCVVGTEQDIIDIFGHAYPAHQHAPVYMVEINGQSYEVALARTEISTGGGSEAFDFVPASTIEEDLARRDFTINAMAVDVFSGGFIDPFGGLEDLYTHHLDCVDEDSFVESAERAGRAVAFIAIFGFTPSVRLVDLCADMLDDFIAIPSEQKWKQFFFKMLSRGSFFVEAFDFMVETGLIVAFPELDAMFNCPQNPVHHPEGNVLTHTALCMEYAANQFGDWFITSVALMHDMGKPDCTFVNNLGEVVAHGHEDHHAPILSFMERIHFPHRYRTAALALISVHMRKNDIPSNRSRSKLLRFLLANGVSVDQFVKTIMFDVNGRGFSASLPQDVADFVIFAQDKENRVEAIRPPFGGRDLIAMGLIPGPLFSQVIDHITELFIAGELETREDCIEEAVHFISEVH